MPFVERAGARLHYLAQGKGPPVLMVQGVGVIGEGWRPQVDQLSEGYQVAVIDNRGIGQSQPCSGPITIAAMAEDALAVMDALEWPAAHLVGHSMGGVIVQHMALIRPERVRSLSLLCTFSRGGEAARLTWPVLKMTIRTRLGTAAMRRRAFMEMLMPPAHLAGKDVAALARRTGELVGRDLATSPPILMRQLQAMRGSDLSARLAELTEIPTLIASAVQDPIALTRYGMRLRDAIPGSRYVELADASHGVTIEQPHVINPLLLGFLAEVEAMG
jgi:pimeloyl-ACP methyl ester carboxylesterase